MRPPFLQAAGALSLLLVAGRADDWPQWRGPNRDGVWNETGILEAFPPGGLAVRWRAPVGPGNSTPVVAGGRVYVTDSELQNPKVWERLHCFDEKSGQRLWDYSEEVKYPEWAFDPKNETGPCPTPTVHEGRVFTLGATTQICCLDAITGALIWRRDLVQGYGLEEFENTTPSPLIEGGFLIVVIGGKPGACVVALDLQTGKEAWRALDDPRTYSSPIIITAGGKRQLIVWTPSAVTSLDPATGRTWWREPNNTRGDFAVATPVVQGDRLLISGTMFQLDPHKPAATVLWPDTKALSRRVLSHTSMPLILGEHVFAGKISGHLVCLEARTGRQVWESDKVTGLKSGASIHLTPNGGSVLLFTDQGNLIRARLTPQGYAEVSRTQLINPTYPFAGRNVVWPPPAYANGHVFARNDDEVICASLAAKP